MMDMLAELFGEGAARLIAWGVGILILIILLLVALRLLRGAIPGTFISGGKNRKHRLAVVDATAIDSARRLVLVRRDGTEHLLLIGGANDLVVERAIGSPPAVVSDQPEAVHQPTGEAAGKGGGGPQMAMDHPVAAAVAHEPEGIDHPPAASGAAARQESGEDARISAIASAVQRQSAQPAAPRPAPSPEPALEQVVAARPVESPAMAPAPVQPAPVQPAPARPLPTVSYQRPASGPAAITGTVVGAASMARPAAPKPEETQPVLQAAATPPPAPVLATGPMTEPEPESLDASLLRELEETLAPVKLAARPQTAPASVETTEAEELSLEDEMSRLLADLTRDGGDKTS